MYKELTKFCLRFIFCYTIFYIFCLSLSLRYLYFSLSPLFIWTFIENMRVYKGIYFINNKIWYPYQNINQDYFWFGFLCAFGYAIYLNQTIKTPMYIYLYANLHIGKSHSKSILLLLLIFMLMYNIYTSAKSNIIHLFEPKESDHANWIPPNSRYISRKFRT